MADLDDFFAKKDRKKSKGKKFTTTEEIAKKLEETGKRIEKPKIKDKITNAEGEESQPVEEEDEWREFEEEKKDYTGLKLGNLTVNETAEIDSDDDRGTGENSSDGESGEPGGKHSGPWKKTSENQQPNQQVIMQEEVPAPPPEKPQQPENQGPKSYKAPHLRNANPSSCHQKPMGSHRGRNIAPDITNEEYFPTLNAKQPATAEAGIWGKRKNEGSFEEVRNRGGSKAYAIQESQAQVPKLTLGNKFGALSQDQS